MPRSMEHLHDLHDHDHDHSALDMSGGPKDVEEKRAKREIANMNERRRMQNINSGFHSLRGLLPQKHDGEKLSKAAILQHTTNYIYQLEREVASLLSQNSELKRLVGGSAAANLPDTNSPEWIKRLGTQPPDCPSCKRRKYDNNNGGHDIDSSPLGGDGSSTESSSEHEMTKGRARKQNGKVAAGEQTLRKQLHRIEKQLEEERKLRMLLEEELNYQNKSSVQNGRQLHHQSYHLQHNPSLDPVADEVEIASESIEIEMHSCPASPPETITMANCDQLASSGHSSASVYLGQHSLDMSHHHHHAQQPHQRQSKNAIALPIDVPFVAPREVSPDTEMVHSSKLSPVAMTNSANQVVFLIEPGNVVFDGTKLHTSSSGSSQILHLVDSKGAPTAALLKQLQSSAISNHTTTSTTTATPIVMTQPSHKPAATTCADNGASESPESAQKTSRQNLNTIVEAIRHLEGDHLFSESDRRIKVESPLRLKKEVCHEFEESANNQRMQHESTDPKTILDSLATGTATNLSTTAIYTSTSATLASIIAAGNDSAQHRPQVIQAIARPNVIVANSVEN